MPAPLLLGGVGLGLLGVALPSLAEVKQKILNGIPYTAHIDENDSPCSYAGNMRSNLAGCYAKTPDGTHHIWHSSVSPPWVINHELAHLQGMEHSPWAVEKGFWGDAKNCAYVTTGGGGYDPYTKICNTPTGETRELNALMKAIVGD